MGLGKFLKKVLKVAAIVAAVVSVVSFVAPAFGEMVTGALSNIGSAISNTVSQIFAGGEAAASVATESAAGAAASTGTAAGAGASAADIAAMADVGMNTAATEGLTQAASQAALHAAEVSANSALPASEVSAHSAADVISKSGFPGPDAFGEGLVPQSTQLVAPQTSMVGPDMAPISNPGTLVEGPAGGLMPDSQSMYGKFLSDVQNQNGGLLSKALEGAKAVGDWAKNNQLLAAVGLKTVAGMLQESPYQAQARAQMEYEDWARKRLNDSINGTTSPFNASGPQQRLRYVGGGYVFPNTPQGIISQYLAR
jgi:hypothetical protein